MDQPFLAQPEALKSFQLDPKDQCSPAGREEFK